MSYGELVERIADAMLVRRPRLGIDVTMTGLASVVASAIAGEDAGLIGPLMESLEHDLLPRHEAAPAFGVRLHSFDAAVERALREWERDEELVGAMSTVSRQRRPRRAARGGLEADHGPGALPRLGHDPPQDRDADDGPVREGFQVEQRLALRGAPFTVHWTLTECDAPNLGTWEGKGPAGSYARVTNRLSPNGNGGTHFEYENTFEAPGRRDGPARVARAGRRHAEARGRQVAEQAQGAARALSARPAPPRRPPPARARSPRPA